MGRMVRERVSLIRRILAFFVSTIIVVPRFLSWERLGIIADRSGMLNSE